MPSHFFSYLAFSYLTFSYPDRLASALDQRIVKRTRIAALSFIHFYIVCARANSKTPNETRARII
jgi:hypothetical protein